MKTYSVWWDIIWYGEFKAESEWEARLLACGGCEEEAHEVEACEV